MKLGGRLLAYAEFLHSLKLSSSLVGRLPQRDPAYALKAH
jgi:hypothetical protein